MKAAPDLKSVRHSLAELVPRPIGWSQSDRDLSRRKFIKIIGGLIASATGVSVLGLFLMLYPQHATTIWLAQLVCLLTLTGFVLAALACARKCFFDPLGHLRKWASEIRQGNFSARVPAAMDGGFARLADDINRLAEWLESLANDAEKQLRLQAERLASKTQSLQLLYEVSALINQAPGNDELIVEYLGSLKTVLDARMAKAFVQTPTGMQLLSTIGHLPRGRRVRGEKPGPAASDAGMEKVVVPMKYKDRVLGKYELYFEQGSEVLGAEILDLLPDIGRHLGMAMEKTRLEQDALNMSAMEERAQVANELHDSLAQTLAGLKFQVRVLDETIAQGEESSVWAQMERVENSLEEATLELRDLIAQFRGPGDSSRSTKTIDQVISRFRRRSDMQVVFHNYWRDVDIPVEWERQTARVIQEALANAQKHSQASTIRVLLRRADDGCFEAIVEDDGIGFDQPATSSHPGEHIGLSIMQERAEHIGGELIIDSEPGEGTRVLLRLRKRQPTAAAVEPLASTA